MKKNYTLPAILSIALVVAIGFAITGFSKSNEYQAYIRHGNEKSFSLLVESFSQLNAALEKGVYSNSTMTTATQSAQIWREALASKSALSSLPFYDESFDNLQSFIGKVGDYSYHCLKNASSGIPISEEERNNISELSKVANKISHALNDAKTQVHSGKIDLNEASKIDKLTDDLNNGDGTQTVLSDNKDSKNDFPEYPTLIYDGPFSAHLDKVEPVFLKGEKELSKKETLKKAEEFLEIDSGILSFQSESNGTITAHTHSNEGGDISINISKNGGYVVDMLNSRDVSSEKLSLEECIEKAKLILDKKGYKNMKESYATKFDGKYVINFAPEIDGVIYYPDLVKIGIFADDGTIASFESRGYLMSHSDRVIDKDVVSLEVAKKSVAANLQIISGGLAIIPSSGKHEVLCYEFICKSNEGKDYIVYIDAKTGKENSILILIEDENGQLTI